VAEGTGREFDSGHADVTDVAREDRAILVVLGEPLRSEEAALSQDRVDRSARVPLTHDEAIPKRERRISRIQSQDLPIENGEDVSGRQA
jgi:hypothetical protein